MRTFFIDANVIIDWLNSESVDNKLCTQCIETIVGLYKKPMVSCTSIAISYYLISKEYKNKPMVAEKLQKAFSFFDISTENEEVGRKALYSNLPDLEDAIQYHSAILSKADAIITFNGHDFFGSKIPVMHPAEFLHLHTIH